MKTGNNLQISTSPTTRPARKLRLTARAFYRKTLRCHTGKEQDSETGLYYYGARYLDSRTGRWLSGDPAVGDYVPQAPVNDEARKQNESLPGMGGVFNYANLHVYHYTGNNPVKYTDPNGRWFGMKAQAKRVRDAIKNSIEYNYNGFYVSLEERFAIGLSADNNADRNVTNESRRTASDSGFDRNQSQDYIEGEVNRYSNFAEIRNRSPEHNAEANNVLDQAEKIEKSHYDRTHPRKRDQQSYREADKRANEVIDNFIIKYDQDYIPPVYPGSNDE